MTSYNDVDFEPPAPVAYVILRNSITGVEWRDVPMLLDLGADISLVPQNAVNQLQLSVTSKQSYELVSFDGHKTVASGVQLELAFCQRIFKGQFLLINQTWGILGRNILNQIPLLFDGPRLEWTEH